MRIYLVTLIHDNTRVLRHVIAGSAMRATEIALGFLPETPKQFAIICKPIK